MVKCSITNGTVDEIRARDILNTRTYPDYETCYDKLTLDELKEIVKIVFDKKSNTTTDRTKIGNHRDMLKRILSKKLLTTMISPRSILYATSNELQARDNEIKEIMESISSNRPLDTRPDSPRSVEPVSTAPVSTVKVAPVASNVTRKAVSKPSFFNQQKIARNARNARVKAAANDEKPPPPPQVNTQANEEDVIPPPPVNTQAIEYARQKANQTAKAAKQREQEVEGARAAGDAALAAAQNDIEKRKEDLGIISAIEARLALGNPKKLKKSKKIITAELAVELAVKKAEQAKIAAEAQLAQAQSQQSNAQRREKEALAKFKQLAPVEAEVYAASVVKEAERARLEAGTNALKEAKAEAIALGNKVPASTTTTSTIAATAITAANTTASTAARAKVEVKPVPTNSKLIRITRDENGIFHKEIVTPGSNPKSIDGESRLFRLTREGGTYKIEQVPLLTRNIPPLTRNPLYTAGPKNTNFIYKGGRRTKKRK